ncbi:primosomal protein N' [candidate division TM6 bacterium RIFCSPHIGHO2_12_FULL_36_22]|nr:MAG: primosomal protein N' [candidate division TM6 bacterium RIFCSPHIGHO2_12_FULL_36_22]
MYIQVKLLKGFAKPLTYKLPPELESTQLEGSIVEVPIRSYTSYAFVEKQFATLAYTPSFTIKTAHSLMPFPSDPEYINFIKKISNYHQVDDLHLIKRMRNFLIQEQSEGIAPGLVQERKKAVTLTAEQQNIVTAIIPDLTAKKFAPSLLHGVTGSGKTEVYKKLIVQNFLNNKTTILLLPEVTLALQFENILRGSLEQEIPIFGFHSGISPKIKRELWQALLNQKPILIVGVHLPILLPIANLGLIIIDEEHESGFQEKKHPKLNTKEIALIRAQQYKIPILLGSATPSISSLYNVKQKGWKFFQLTTRYRGNFPVIKTVYLNDKQNSTTKRRSFWISKELDQHIADRLAKKEQAIIFINRRGFSFFVQCKDCNFIFECNACSVSLTLHDRGKLSCHYCDYAQTMPTECPKCAKKEFLKKGIGTQQVVSILEQLFPQARIGRADMDTTVKRKNWQKTLADFQNGEIDILVGTQTITKGYHFPKVTLVGILWADLNLHFPIYNASETTLQQLIQVAGRAGRESLNSMVIVQAMQEHPIFDYLNEVDYPAFYQREIEARSMLKYPPCGRFCEIELMHTDEALLAREATHFAAQLHKNNTRDVFVLGPALPPINKIKNSYRRKIYLKAASMATIIELYQIIDHTRFKSKIFFTPNPLV